MKKLLIAFSATLLMFTSCGKSSESSNDGESTKVTEDSLRQAIAQRDSLLQFVAEVNQGMSQLVDMQNELSDLGNDLEGESLTKPDFNQQVNQIRSKISAYESRLAQLEKQLSDSKDSNAALISTINTLKKQIANQKVIISNLTQQLAEAGVKIEQQEEQIEELNTTVTNITSERDIAQERSEQLLEEINKCFYYVGTKSELKKNKIIESGFLKKTKILPADFEKQFFTTADKTTLTTINTYSKKVKVLTEQPSDSYTIEDNNGRKALKITNPSRFWEKSNYLVIQID